MNSPAVTRTRLHTRTVNIEGYQRSDGLWDIEGRITDVKDHDFGNVAGFRPAGKPIHDMRLTITVDEHLKIHAARASMDGIPFGENCKSVEPDYGNLVGLTIGKGFRKAATELVGGTRGCTHVTELLWVVATTAFQTLAAHLYAHQDPHKKPFQLDGCHAWDTHSPLVQQYYPRWHRKT